MGTSCQPSDVDLLRAAFASWHIEARWITRASGPDRCRYVARKGDVRLSAWSADELATQITAAQVAEGMGETE
jgi:hypothetical protein